MAISRFYPATSLTGGTEGSLDDIDGNILHDKDAALIITSDGLYVYFLDVDSGLGESSPDIISPDSNAGDKRWILVSMFRAIQSIPQAGEYRIKNIRRDTAGKLVVTYDDEEQE